MSATASIVPDPHDVRAALRAPGLLDVFNQAGVLAAADVHVAVRLGALGGESDPTVLLAVALAVSAPRESHVCTDLAAASETATSDLEIAVDLASLPWPEREPWTSRVAASPIVAVGDDDPGRLPLRLVGTRLYLDRYWRGECDIARDLRARAERGVVGIDRVTLAAGLTRLFPADGTSGPDLQKLASATAVLRALAVVAGGPGTGKTTTAARVLALLDEQAAGAGARPLRIALAAPTGKAAARLEAAVHQEAGRLDVSAATRRRLVELQASTLHRLLGWRPDSRSRFRHDRRNRLPHDVVVVDETSMVSLSLMAKLVEAVGADARLVLLGDPDQLASVEAGAVLGDIVGPSATALHMDRLVRDELAALTGQSVPAMDRPGQSSIGNGIVVLRRVHRFGGAIGALAHAVQEGDADSAMATLRAGADDVRWIDVDVADPRVLPALASLQTEVVGAGRRVVEHARAGESGQALEALNAVRVLCAHRRGPYGVTHWMLSVERWLRREIEGYGEGGAWYVGRPLLVTANDYGLRLYNGDTGVVVAHGDEVRAVFERRGEVVEVPPNRLDAVDTVHAMTVHKSQGSQFGTVAVMLPDIDSLVLTRELLYTAITRAQVKLVLVGPEATVRAAINRPVARSSGLQDRLWC